MLFVLVSSAVCVTAEVMPVSICDGDDDADDDDDDTNNHK